MNRWKSLRLGDAYMRQGTAPSLLQVMACRLSCCKTAVILSLPQCVTSFGQYPGWGPINTLRPRQNGRHFADDIFKRIFLNENVWMPTTISLKFVPKGPINNIPALVQIMVWRRPGDKPLSEPMMVSLPTHTCVTRPQWVNKHGSTLIPAWISNHV